MRKWRFSDVMFCYFGSKSGKCLKGSRMYNFEVKGNPWTPKDVTMNALPNGSLVFLTFSILTPITQNFDFQKLMPVK